MFYFVVSSISIRLSN